MYQTCGLWRRRRCHVDGVVVDGTRCKSELRPERVLCSCRLRWFSPESPAFVRTTTAVRQECWSVTGRRFSKPG